ncbi:MAG: SpoIID/LytB domain-containing protein, partial [Clostridium celatum]|nr:SpoIID/LytB domain-containing protein [Clostridium celatum]
MANEMPVSFNVEALKAQAIASRTYVVSKMI